MAEQEYQHQRMLNEYDTLRAEVLQVYEQQMNLVFGATITAAVALFVTLMQSSAVLLGLPTLLTILIGICYKSIANYSRIYRIGSYIAVVHEQQGAPLATFRPSPRTAAYHSRWRRAARSGLIPRTGGSGAKAEAWFLLLLGVAGWVLIGGSIGELFFVGPMNIAVFSLSVAFTVIFLYYWYQLIQVFQNSKQYEDGFRRILEDEAKEK